MPCRISKPWMLASQFLHMPFPAQNPQAPISTPHSSKFSKSLYRNSAMELELGFKITKTRDTDHTSADFRITKDRAGPIFFSTETETMFILTAHLKGFRRQRIKIDINEDGTQISISGEKLVQEMVMTKWIMHNKPVEIKRFIKVFRIPDGVVLDRIKARFNEEDTILSIFMPKSRKGIRGIGIEEVKEEEIELVTEQSTSVPEMEIVEETDQEQKETTTEIRDEDTEIEEIITIAPTEEIEDVVPAIEIQDSETENIVPLEIQPEEKVVEPTERIPEYEDQNVEMMEIEPKQAPIEEIRRNNDLISEEITEKEEDLAAEITETVAEQGNDSSTSTSESVHQLLPEEEEVIENQELDEVDEIIQEEEEIDQVQQIPEEEEIIEETDLAFVEEEELTETEEEVTGNVASEADDGGKGRGIGMFRFPTPRFMVGSAFIGLLIALIIQLLKKNKNTQRKY